MKQDVARTRYAVDPRLNVIVHEMGMHYPGASACSHRPHNVRELYQDANSRFYMAVAILAALDGDPMEPLDLWDEVTGCP